MPRMKTFSQLTAAREVSFAAAFLCAAVLTGCQSTDNATAWQPTSDAEAQLKDPERLRLTYAQMSEQRGDYKTAREAYLQASAENPQSPEAVLGLARLDLLAGRVQAAERQFLQAYQLAPENSLVIESLGQFYLTQDRFDEAVRHLSQGIELTPGNKRMRHRLAVSLAKQGNIAAAEPHFAQSVGDAEADYNIGLILYEQGELKQAEQRFLNAVLKKPALAQAQHWLDAVRQESQKATETQLASASQAASEQQPVQQLTGQQPTQSAVLPGRPQGTASVTTRTPQAPQLGQQAHSTVPNAQSAVQPQSLTPAQPQRASQGLDLRTLNATQLEQLENSLSPTERASFHHCLRTGTPFVR